MDSRELKRRTKGFALRVIGFSETLPRSQAADIMKRQLIRAATAVGANYRSACRARSKPDFISKMTIVEEEADECCYWLELLSEANIGEKILVKTLWNEADELTAIFVASCKTARRSLP